MNITTAPFTDTDALEDSALLAALDNSSGNLHAPDGARLVSLGLATVNEAGHYFLTDDGRAVAEELREHERLLIPDEVLKIVLSRSGRAHGKRAGWIAGFTTFHRPYIEYVRLPHMSPDVFDELVNTGSTWVDIPFRVFSQLGGYAEREGARIYFAPPFRPSWAPDAEPPVPGTPSPVDRDSISAMGHADSVWADLCDDGPGCALRVRPVGGLPSLDAAPDVTSLLFHHASRDVSLTLDERGRYVATIINVDAPHYGWLWRGHRADVAVKAMCRSLYGKPCAHEYGTGRDSCPGCDASAEQFEDRHPVRGAMPSSLPLTRL